MRVKICVGLLISFVPTLCNAMDVTDEEHDVHFADVRIGYGVPLGSMRGTYQTASASTQVDRVTWSKVGEISLKWVPSLSQATDSGSGLVAFGLSTTRYELSDGTQRQKIEQRLLLATADLGLAWALASDWTIEGAWHLGLGQASQPGEPTGAGTAWTGGIATEVTKRLWRGFTVGLRSNLEWRSWDDSATFDGVAYDVTFSGLQFVPALVIGWRF